MKSLLAAVSVCLAFSTAANAQPARNNLERANDRRELRQNTREAHDDRADKARVSAVIAQFDAARAVNDVSALASIDAQVSHLLALEQRETGAELRRDVAEVRQGQRELASDRREIVGNNVHRAGPAVRADDRRDLRDDRRDLHDDRRDAAREAGKAGRLSALASDWASLRGRADPLSLDRKRAILSELNGFARQELAENRQEAREDRRELREDRRETREDRRRR